MKSTKRIVITLLTMILLICTIALPASAAENLVHGIGFIKGTSLRLRAEASTSAPIVATAYQNECVIVLEKTGQWYKVNYNLQIGYMHEDYLTVSSKENAELGYAEIRGSGVNMRSGPSTSHSIIAVGTQGSKAYIIGINEGWFKVIYQDKICYIRSDFIKLTEYPYENRASSNAPKFFRTGNSLGVAPTPAVLNGSSTVSTPSAAVVSSAANGNQILAEAKKYLGAPYIAGGASPSGFDCSGFVYYVLKQLGFSPYRTPASQFNQGTAVSKDALQPGDIVFFADTYASGISHVGIYAGNGSFIHAPNSRSTVSYSDLTSGYWANHYYGARRMA